MQPYDDAKEVKRAAESGEEASVVCRLQDKLMSYPAKEPMSISCACELLPLVERTVERYRVLTGASDVRGMGNRLLAGVIDEIDSSLSKRKVVGEKREYYQLLARYLRGDELSVADFQFAKEERWGVLRESIRQSMERELRVSNSVTGMSSEERLEPLIDRLQERSLEVVETGELQGAQVVRLFTDMVKLQAQLKGELKDKVEIELSPGKAYKELLLRPEQFQVAALPSESSVEGRLLG